MKITRVFTRRSFLGTVVRGGAVWGGANLWAQSLPQIAPTPEPDSLLHSGATWRRFRAAMTTQSDHRTLLGREADRWLTGEVLTIVHKKTAAPSGDPHDYVSLAPYSWPDPTKPNGLPWIGRDGEVNPAFYDYDNPMLERLCHAVPRLVLHAEAATSAAHARRAGRLLRAWFLESETRMNPHLRYAQKIPGRSDGSSLGIIDATSLIFLADAASRLTFNDEWTAADLAGVKTWFARYVDWLLTSAPGRKEGAATNNHGSWYDAQVACFAAFADRPDLARQQIERQTMRRLAQQIEPDGRQPAELRRTLALTYSTYNLLAHACTAQVAAPLGLDLWSWKTPDGRSLRRALQWLLPYYAKEQTWKHSQIHAFDFTSAAVLLNFAGQRTGDPALGRVCDSLEKRPWQRLLFSKASLTGRELPRPQ